MGCIYKYTNKINGKSYIGQTNRSFKKRHWQHLSQHESYFDRALRKYGIENFTYEILEDNIFDEDLLNEREIYYIDKYDSFNNGYNLTRGGSNGTRFNQEDRDKIGELIKNTNKSLLEIGNEIGYSVYTVSDINQGYLLPKENEKYPLRGKRNSEHFTYNSIELVIGLLKYTSFDFTKIAELTNTNFYFVVDINKGKRTLFNNKNITFPIRNTVKRCPMNIQLAQTIINELKKEDKSAEEIAKELNIPAYTVGNINRGKHSICKLIKENYPIRKKQYKKANNYNSRKIQPEQLKEIVDLLINTSLSLEEISQRYSVKKDTINRINQGETFKEELKQYKFPIRINKKYNMAIQFSGVNE